MTELTLSAISAPVLFQHKVTRSAYGAVSLLADVSIYKKVERVGFEQAFLQPKLIWKQKIENIMAEVVGSNNPTRSIFLFQLTTPLN